MIKEIERNKEMSINRPPAKQSPVCRFSLRLSNCLLHSLLLCWRKLYTRALKRKLRKELL